jgi:hypothetical protein
MSRITFASLLSIIVFSSCGMLNKTARKELSDGFYTRTSGLAKRLVYVNVVDDTLRIHPAIKTNKQPQVEPGQKDQYFLSTLETKTDVEFTLTKKSFDVDFLTIPLKYRFARKTVPPQLNSNINGAAYFGFRTDRYFIDYESNPLLTSERKITHVAYSLGIFCGLGNTFLNATNSDGALQQEYDGMVCGKGLAGIVAINNFTVGLTLGFDNLLDRNRKVWIYENKPWLGLGFGLNLN